MNIKLVEFLPLNVEETLVLNEYSKLHVIKLDDDYYFTKYVRKQYKNKLLHVYTSHICKNQLIYYLSQYDYVTIEKEVK